MPRKIIQVAPKPPQPKAPKSPQAVIPIDADVFVRDTAVAVFFDVTRITVWRWVRDNADFPKPFKFSPGCSRWKLSAIKDYAASRQAA